jgi:hypothetical protein
MIAPDHQAGPNSARRSTRRITVQDDCDRLGFYSNGDPDFPEQNRLFTDCVWDADAQRWERKQ